MSSIPLAPIVKWVGGKRQLLPEISKRLPESMGTYFEPFMGGGAVLLAIRPEKAVISDLNYELINLYRVARDTPNELLELVRSYPNEPDFYYELRALDREKAVFEGLSSVQRAARMWFLNKMGYNGLYRVNSKGQNNVPFGKYKNPRFDEVNLFAVSEYLKSVDILHSDYRDAVVSASEGDFVYFDPPYDPVSATAAFTAYSPDGFSRESQRELMELCLSLDERGVKFMLSNSNTDYIRDLYSGFHIYTIEARRAINSVGCKRGVVEEVLVTNYGKGKI